ncbi:MAG: cytochrome bc complex cytochrome b subunit [Ktedonobacterales bacterium]
MSTMQRQRPRSLLTQVTDVALDWLDARVPMRSLLARLLSDPTPKSFGWLYTFGGVILYLLTIQIVTGIFLLFHYVPSWNSAYDSIQFIDHNILLGSWVRGIHYWNAYMILFVLGIHMGRTFFSGAYKKPRELTWILGVLLFILMVAVAYTGASLRQDQAGYWTAIIGPHIAGWTPIIGEWAKEVWLGSDRLGPSFLTRSFALHVWVIPGVLLAVAGIHVLLIVVQGEYGSWLNYRRRPEERVAAAMDMPPGDERESYLKALEEVADPKSYKIDLPDDTDYFFPEHSFREFVMTLGFFIPVYLLAIFIPPGLEDRADPGTTTYVPLPEWFMLPADQVLPYLPGIMVPLIPVVFGVFMLVLFLVPFLDRGEETNIFKRPVAMAGGVLVPLTIFFLTLLAIYRIENFPVH